MRIQVSEKCFGKDPIEILVGILETEAQLEKFNITTGFVWRGCGEYYAMVLQTNSGEKLAKPGDWIYRKDDNSLDLAD